ncbi:uncharacterized protein LOC127410273 isoform X2 [Myxocyprinus asiaticus]|uniref:uncharacterized protein LOC127410273 isoform X2 n=1 Tax=Myxocyprinus asiaticus TaxID=70543 RepID=UPI002221DDF0|nr:uncharacterized protein LOC127410273 isoform X2 [Myxocyprinus asiaticus]
MLDFRFVLLLFPSQMAMHFSWYKHEPGQNPRLISTIYKYNQITTFYHNFKNNSRFSVMNEKGVHQLVISNLQSSDSATYYCGSAYSNVMEFVHGTKLIVEGLQGHIDIQHHDIFPVHPGDNIHLKCTVLNQNCEGNQTVYWLIHESRESHPRIIKVHEMSVDQCKRSLETRICVYNFTKRNLSFCDVGTYFCAVVACGEIFFGNGTKLDILAISGADSTEQMTTFVLLSIIRTLLLLIISITFYFWYCVNSRRITRAGSSQSDKAFRKRR